LFDRGRRDISSFAAGPAPCRRTGCASRDCQDFHNVYLTWVSNGHSALMQCPFHWRPTSNERRPRRTRCPDESSASYSPGLHPHVVAVTFFPGGNEKGGYGARQIDGELGVPGRSATRACHPHCAQNAYRTARLTTRKRRFLPLHSASLHVVGTPTGQHGQGRIVPRARGLDQFREPEWATSAKLPSCGLACAMAARVSPS
jgi:hypothetical protein